MRPAPVAPYVGPRTATASHEGPQSSPTPCSALTTHPSGPAVPQGRLLHDHRCCSQILDGTKCDSSLVKELWLVFKDWEVTRNTQAPPTLLPLPTHLPHFAPYPPTCDLFDHTMCTHVPGSASSRASLALMRLSLSSFRRVNLPS